eukprot:Hpha_TRINITY_DN26051_c0_g1::TRINITY_DN26051_c0_g1_i1::g.115338::m.115338
MSEGMQALDLALNVGLIVFVGRLVVASAIHWEQLFLPKYGRPHRLLGLLLFAYITFGLADARLALVPRDSWALWLYDALLSLIGAAVAYTAYLGFGKAHRRVKNDASGVLDEAATVSEAEMLEHCFYQLLNLSQVCFLHYLAWQQPGPTVRVALGLGTASPWLFRSRFPVNSFSANYSQPDRGGSTTLIRVLYRLKKYQYLFYKHALLHGLNATMATNGGRTDGLVFAPHFRLYWLCLNTAYVFEFYMQSLVKKQYMSQQWMLILQHLLMAVSTVAAVQVLAMSVHFAPAALSLALNLLRRGRDFTNMMAVLALATVVVDAGENSVWSRLF